MSNADEQRIREFIDASRDIVNYLRGKLENTPNMPLVETNTFKMFIRAFEKVDKKMGD